MSKPVELAPPGAGLPPLERWFASLILHTLARLCSKNRLSRWLAEETDAVLALVASVPQDLARQPVLVPRPGGLEDSSRHWSLNMVLHHLCIVDGGIHQMARALAAHKAFPREVRIAEVKPRADAGPEQAQQLRDLVAAYREFIAAQDRLDTSPSHPHPWFGPLNLQGWLALSVVHTRIHRRQIQAILARLC